VTTSFPAVRDPGSHATAVRPSPESVAERFARLLREHGPALRRLAAGYEADQHEREDLLQEIALALWMALPSFRGECSERTFVFRIGHNRALTHRRRRQARPPTLDDMTAIADPRADPEADLARAQHHDRLMAAVRRLPHPHRQVTMLSLEGLSHREIAEVLGITENNVAVRLSRARTTLGRMLAGGKR
jgi:RNA polymerase sigma factor (sigma-70 family)